MKKLSKFTLDYNENKNKWSLKKDNSNKVVKNFANKESATKGGILSKALGKEGGSVKIMRKHGGIQEERTFPKKRDPIKSKG